MKELSTLERKKLDTSPYVSKITSKNQIQFTKIFKELILNGPSDGLTRTDYFNHLLGVSCFDKSYIYSCITRWRSQKKMPSYLDKRGKNKSIHKMSMDELKAENAYQKEVIAHLKKLRGLTDDEL